MSDMFGNRVVVLMSQHNVDNHAVAKGLGVSRQAVSKWRNNGNINYDNLVALAAFFKVNWVWLRYGNKALRSACIGKDVTKINIDHQYWCDRLIHHNDWCCSVFDLGEIGVWSLDFASNIYEWSQEMMLIFECEEHEFGDNFESLNQYLFPEDRDEVNNTWKGCCVGTAGEFKHVHKIITKKANLRWINCAGKVLYNDDGTPEKMIGVVTDITDKIEKKFNQRILAEVFDNITDEIFIMDSVTGYFINVNNRACENTGYSKEELLLMHPMDLKPTVSPEGFTALCERAKKINIGLTFDTLQTRKNGSVYPVKIHFRYFEGTFLAVVQDTSRSYVM